MAGSSTSAGCDGYALEVPAGALDATRFEADLLLGEHGELAGELEALVRAHPLRERLWGQLIVALFRSGRQGDALGAYQRARAVLADERIDTDRAVARFGDHATLDAAFAESLRDPEAVLSMTRARNSDRASGQRS